MSTLYVDTINEKTSGNGVQIPGHVVQEVHHPCVTVMTLSSTSYVDLTGASVTFTPKANNSKLLVQCVQHFYLSQYGTAWSGGHSAIVIDGNLQSTANSDNTTVYGVGSRDTNQVSGQSTRLMSYDHQTATYTVSSTNAIIIKAQVKLLQAIGDGASVNDYGRGFIRITEIAQ